MKIMKDINYSINPLFVACFIAFNLSLQIIVWIFLFSKRTPPIVNANIKMLVDGPDHIMNLFCGYAMIFE